MKRCLDLIGAGAALAVLWPLLAAVALLIKLDTAGPVLYRQWRIGRWGVPFRIWKFRTMIPDADRQGPPLTVGGDRRITRLGQWLRKLEIDELPQLLNVLAGEMSLVGPRPEVPQYVARYDRRQRAVLNLVPGITDPASIRFFQESELLAGASDPQKLYVQKIMPEKIRMNLDYARQATLWTDLLVLVQTLLRTGVFQIFHAPCRRAGES